jgi:hypothetical protein
MGQYRPPQGQNMSFIHERRKTMVNDLFAEIEADQTGGSAVESLDTGGVASIAEVARAVRNKQDEIELLDSKLKQSKKDLLKLTDEDLPALLHEVGVSKMELEDGSKVELKPTYGAYIKVENRDSAYSWLQENGYDDIIKNVISCQFGRGEDQMANDLMSSLAGQGYPAAQKRDIHPQTLKAFVKDQVESGKQFPMDLFGAYVGQRANIKKG